MVLAFYCKELADFTTEELHEYLADTERAGTLGFDPDQFAPDKTAPGRTTFRRAWREHFPEQLKLFIQTSAERILGVRTVAVLYAVHGIPGFTLPSDTVYSSWEDDFISDPFTIEDGAIRVPQQPGLGVEVSYDKISEYRIA